MKFSKKIAVGILIFSACGKKEVAKDTATDIVVAKADASCDDDKEGKIFYVSGEKKLYVCKGGILTVVDTAGTTAAAGPAGAAGADGAVGTVGAAGTTGAGYSNLNLSSITPTALGSNGSAYVVSSGGVVPATLTTAVDEFNTALATMTTITTAGVISSTASATGCLKLDLNASYTGIINARVRLRTQVVGTSPTVRWEFTNDTTANNWNIGASFSTVLSTTNKDFTFSSAFHGRHVALCIVQPGAGMQLVEFNTYGIQVNYL